MTRRAAFAFIAATSLAAPGAAEPVPPITATWFIGDSIQPDSFPLHLALGSNPPDNRVFVVTASKLLPNVLVAIEAPIPAAEKRQGLAAGTQLFQLARQERLTFCAFTPVSRSRFGCFIDSDGDGALDTAMLANYLLLAPPVLVPEGGTAEKLAVPVRFRPVPRTDCLCKMSINLEYMGRRRMTKRDATFTLGIGKDGEYSRSRDIPLYLDSLPPRFEVLGARFETLRRDAKILHFDLASGFATGPFEPGYGPGGINWGF